MKTRLILALIVMAFVQQVGAQRACSTFEYQQNEVQKDPSLKNKMEAVEAFTQNHLRSSANILSRLTQTYLIKIPVVVHILYHEPGEDISDAQVMEQINALNRDYRRANADSVNTPSYFKSVAADCEIEFHLATSDPKQRSTTGIIRKYTPITYWEEDDQMKFSSSMGDDAWDSKSYLNIWVCNLRKVVGYSSVLGGPTNKDGVVIAFSAFGETNTLPGYDKGRTAVHEVGHWLNLKHPWGDANCGDDFVDDTPRQSTYTIGCPTGTRISCGNAPNGDMYMNYMDFTNDACMNLFTEGQKERMRALFDSGGVRSSILYSTGLNTALIFEASLPDNPPQWLHPQVYPNPANNVLNLDVAYDTRWIGKIMTISNLQGQTVMQFVINSKLQKIDISKLQSGMYFLSAKKEDGPSIKEKFVKLY
ncbi:MAG TPA: T9SS type A sorting domain-containing protein [Chitinophagaceae bacterium]|nr:T9SS type A sorting domain-containing protein [Chitinophagaceae bacterium]